MVEDCQNFLKIIKHLEPYLVDFERDKSQSSIGCSFLYLATTFFIKVFLYHCFVLR